MKRIGATEVGGGDLGVDVSVEGAGSADMKRGDGEMVLRVALWVCVVWLSGCSVLPVKTVIEEVGTVEEDLVHPVWLDWGAYRARVNEQRSYELLAVQGVVPDELLPKIVTLGGRMSVLEVLDTVGTVVPLRYVGVPEEREIMVHDHLETWADVYRLLRRWWGVVYVDGVFLLSELEREEVETETAEGEAERVVSSEEVEGVVFGVGQLGWLGDVVRGRFPGVTCAVDLCIGSAAQLGGLVAMLEALRGVYLELDLDGFAGEWVDAELERWPGLERFGGRVVGPRGDIEALERSLGGCVTVVVWQEIEVREDALCTGVVVRRDGRREMVVRESFREEVGRWIEPGRSVWLEVLVYSAVKSAAVGVVWSLKSLEVEASRTGGAWRGDVFGQRVIGVAQWGTTKTIRVDGATSTVDGVVTTSRESIQVGVNVDADGSRVGTQWVGEVGWSDSSGTGEVQETAQCRGVVGLRVGGGAVELCRVSTRGDSARIGVEGVEARTAGTEYVVAVRAR